MTRDQETTGQLVEPDELPDDPRQLKAWQAKQDLEFQRRQKRNRQRAARRARAEEEVPTSTGFRAIYASQMLGHIGFSGRSHHLGKTSDGHHIPPIERDGHHPLLGNFKNLNPPAQLDEILDALAALGMPVHPDRLRQFLAKEYRA